MDFARHQLKRGLGLGPDTEVPEARMLVSRSLFELIREMGRPEFKDPDDRLNSIVPPPPRS